VHEPQGFATRQSIGHLLRTHPEGQSLFGEAGHRRVLADQSAADVTRAFTSMQECRLGYEELRHRLDPRRSRTIHLDAGLALLAAIFMILAALDAVELAGVLTGWTAAAATAAAAAWIGFAWLAALAKRERQGRLLTVITVGAVAAGVLVAALHGAGISGVRADVWHRFGAGVLGMLLIFTLTAVAAVIIARMEPASLWSARRRWHRARDEYAAAVAVHRRDAEEAVIAGQGWRNLIEAQANASADGSGQPGTEQRP